MRGATTGLGSRGLGRGVGGIAGAGGVHRGHLRRGRHIPALDGGRLVFLIIEAIRRKPISQKYEIAINAAGFILLIGLMIFATFNDITKLIV